MFKNQSLLKNIDHLLPDPALFSGINEEQKLSCFSDELKKKWIQYLYAEPQKSTTTLNTRQHAIALYNPFGKRDKFPAGLRYCINTYNGCSHGCLYGYAKSYIKDIDHPRMKNNFENLLIEDMKEIRELGLNAVPVHISNSTDCCQSIENTYQMLYKVLTLMLEYHESFSSVTLLTKNPELLLQKDYSLLLQELPKKMNVYVEVSCIFKNDVLRKVYESGAPSIPSRANGIRGLVSLGIPVSLRIDPLFPREPLPASHFKYEKLSKYGAPVFHSTEDVVYLTEKAIEYGCCEIITSPLKLIPGSKSSMPLFWQLRDLYTVANGGTPLIRSGSWKLPDELYHYWKQPILDAAKDKIVVEFCMYSLFKKK